MAKKKDERSFEELLEQLQQTVADLEQGTLPLEELLTRYSQGVELVRACQNKLQQAENVISKTEEGA